MHLCRVAKIVPYVLFLIMVAIPGCDLSSLINIKLQTGSILNVSDSNQSLPVRVKIFQLSDLHNFEQASFEDLWKNEKVVLGNALLAVHERTVGPNMRIELKQRMIPSVKYVGVVATFRNPQGKNWRTFAVINQVWKPQDLKIQLQGSRIGIIP